MESIVFAAAMIAAFIAGAYIRKPFAIVKRKETEAVLEKPVEVDTTAEEYANKINRDLEKMLSYTGRQKGGLDE